MNNAFNSTERLYRSVLPKTSFWTSNQTLTSAAFKDAAGGGTSVDRQGERTEADSLQFASKHFDGNIVSVAVQDCWDKDAIVVYDPCEDNNFHSEIHKNKDTKRLTHSQTKYLADNARIELIVDFAYK